MAAIELKYGTSRTPSRLTALSQERQKRPPGLALQRHTAGSRTIPRRCRRAHEAGSEGDPARREHGDDVGTLSARQHHVIGIGDRELAAASSKSDAIGVSAPPGLIQRLNHVPH